MADTTAKSSPRVYARAAGVLYLIVIVIGFLGEALVRGKLMVPGDPATTAGNIMASELLWRLGIAGEAVLLTCATAMTAIIYVLLRPVSKTLALVAALLDLISIALEGAATLSLVVVLFLLSGAAYLKSFEPQQLQALAYLSAKAFEYGFGISLVFFGCACLVTGYLIFKSGFWPKAIGILIQLAGLCYLINSFALILAPDIAGMLFPGILLPSFIGEASFCLWLIVKGINVSAWEKQSGVVQ